MKTLYILFIICLSATYTFAQPQIKFDTTTIDLGIVTESEKSFDVKYWFTNTGTEPLIISRVQSSGGGFFGSWPKDTILPGKRNFIMTHYDGKRLGPINKAVTVISNAVNEPSVVLKIRGEVLLRKASIEVDSAELAMRTIPFGEKETMSFIVTNTSEVPLHFEYYEGYPTPLIDLFSLNLSLYNFMKQSSDSLKESNYGRIVVEPNEKICVQICLRNNYGNVGQIERYFYFKYNSHDTLKYTVKVNYVGEPQKNKVYEKNNLLEYNEGKLVKMITFNKDGSIEQTSFIQDGHLTKSIWPKHMFKKRCSAEYLFKDDLKVKEVINCEENKKNDLETE
jgi:hypothetical protein